MKKPLFALILTCLAAAGFSARAQDVIDPNHSVVRFEVFTAGTNFGSIDIELFDQEKPQTVQNFLRYVYNKVYSDLVLHQLVPGSFLQAGHVRVPNFSLTNEFTNYVAGTKFEPVPNEYNVGPQISNDFGTVTMARDSGNPDSATSEWFFNLGDNSSLNTNNGGFTVFGRVVNTVSDRTGTNLLNYFNSLSDGHGIATNVLDNFEVLFTPVNIDRTSQSLVGDLFTVRASIIQGPHRVDPNHSIVRFDVITDGVLLGNIDIELFDQEKPETVKNFLLYVYTGVYSNLVLHRADPDFVLQGGRVRIENPFSSSAFSTYIPGVNWGAITNEYSVGPELSNEFGTIAMARVSGQTNSASAEFFFNLANNTNLNTVDGGFTVFGRVVGTFNDHTGTNMLQKFNALSAGNGIKNVFILDFFEFLNELPVSALHYMLSTNLSYVTNGNVIITNAITVTNDAPVQYRDLFTVRASVIQGAARETIPPSVTVNMPTNSLRTTNSSLTFSGTANDNTEVARVFIDAPLTHFVVEGKNSWTAEVPLTPGTNHVQVRSVDYFGNLSPPVDSVIFYSLPRPITLRTVGKGKVAGAVNGQILEVGVTYPLTAFPSRGYYFNGWRGSVASNDRTIYFTMTEDADLTVRFTKSFLGMDAGNYLGVFFPSTNGTPNTTGLISFKLANNGIYSGRLNPIGASYGIRGFFQANGVSVISGALGTNLLVLSLEWLGEGSEGFAGSYFVNGKFFSGLSAWRVQSFSPTNPAPAGLYTFELSPPLAANNGVTLGSSFGNLTVDERGRVGISGVLANNVPFKQKTVLLKGNRFPFFYSDRKGDSLIGLGFFGTNNTFRSFVKWFSPRFQDPTTNQNMNLNGSLYTPPSQARLFDWTNGVITLSGDGLAEPITSEVVLGDDGSFSIPSNSHNIQINVTDATGLVGGTFTHPVSNLPTELKGAVLQSSNSAAGFFSGATNGGFTIRRAP